MALGRHVIYGKMRSPNTEVMERFIWPSAGGILPCMVMGGPKGPVTSDKWAEDLDASKVENTAKLGFFVWFGVAAIVVFAALIVWSVLT